MCEAMRETKGHLGLKASQQGKHDVRVLSGQSATGRGGVWAANLGKVDVGFVQRRKQMNVRCNTKGKGKVNAAWI